MFSISTDRDTKEGIISLKKVRKRLTAGRNVPSNLMPRSSVIDVPLKTNSHSDTHSLGVKREAHKNVL